MCKSNEEKPQFIDLLRGGFGGSRLMANVNDLNAVGFYDSSEPTNLIG